MPTRSAGFTLIELLIVIAIIGILAAVLIPNLLGARKRAADTVAKTYLADAVKMQQIYMTDYNTYATAISQLTDARVGLKAPPTSLTFVIVAASGAGYCMATTSADGSAQIGTPANRPTGTGWGTPLTKGFIATAARGVEETKTGTDFCTTAN